MQESVFVIGHHAVTVAEALGALVAAAVCLGLMLLMTLQRHRSERRDAELTAADMQREMDARMAALLRQQAEMAGRVQAMADGLGQRQSDLTHTVSQRLDGLTLKLGQTLMAGQRSTHDHLSRLHERIAVIDRAQKVLGDLSGEVMQLRSVLSDKQTRGAFGQGRMEAIVQDALPAAAYTFQATLPGGVRPDCLIHMPDGTLPLVIDAKFPLEGWRAFKEAGDDMLRQRAAQGFRRDVLAHIRDISSKYLVPGETQDTAFLFVPSESLFADLHEYFDDIIARAHRARVVLVSPSLLLLAIQVVQAIQRDHRMREQAHLVQSEVGHLMADVERLHERVVRLSGHFGQIGKDIDAIVVSAEKVQKRGARIEDVDLPDPVRPTAAVLVGGLKAGE